MSLFLTLQCAASSLSLLLLFFKCFVWFLERVHIAKSLFRKAKRIVFITKSISWKENRGGLACAFLFTAHFTEVYLVRSPALFSPPPAFVKEHLLQVGFGGSSAITLKHVVSINATITGERNWYAVYTKKKTLLIQSIFDYISVCTHRPLPPSHPRVLNDVINTHQHPIVLCYFGDLCIKSKKKKKKTFPNDLPLMRENLKISIK